MKYFFASLVFLCLVQASFFTSRTASAASIQWNNIASGNWETASNWSGGVLPKITDTAKVYRADSGTTAVNVTTSGQAVAAGLLIKGGFTTLNITSGCDLLSNGPIEIYNGSVAAININGTFTGTSTFKLGGGGAIDTVNVYGVLNLHNDANGAELTMGFSSGGIATLNIYSGGVANIDKYTWSGACTSVIDIKSGGTLNLKGDVRTQVNADIAAGRIMGNRNFGNVIVTYDGTKTILQSAVMNTITTGDFIIDPPTLHCLAFRWYVNGDDNGNATVQVTYKEHGASQWKQALNMLRVNRELVDRDYLPYTCDNLFAGSIMGLNPATSYDVNFVLVDPDGGQATQSDTVQTHSVPIAPPPTNTLHVYPPGWSGDKNQPSYDTISAAFAAVTPGQQILLYPGVHTGNVTINKAGTATAPIVIKGAGSGEAIVSGVDTINNGKNLEITGCKYLFIENISVHGGVYGIYAGGTSPVTGTKNLVVRNCRLTDVGSGIRGLAAGCENWYIADNVIIGRNLQWYPYDISHISEDGIRIYGRGHDVCYNHIERFWDGLGIANNLPDPNRLLKCTAIDMYGNDISQSHDDCIETDYGSHNIRVWGNKLRDAQDGVSCQPVYGGPVYIFKNEMYGFNYTPYKLHNWPSGLYIFNNTSVIDGEGFNSDAIWQNATLRNNLFLGTRNYAMETGSPDPRTTLDYDGYRRTDDPIRFIKWQDPTGNYLRYDTLAAFYSSIGHEQHGIMVDFNAFRNCPVPVIGETHDANYYDLRLATGSSPIDKGVIIPTISENYNGTAPDIGCHEYGDLPPQYGPRGNDFYDYAKFADQWGQTGCTVPDWCGGMDFDKSSVVDWADLSSFADQWLQVD